MLLFWRLIEEIFAERTETHQLLTCLHCYPCILHLNECIYNSLLSPGQSGTDVIKIPLIATFVALYPSRWCWLRALSSLQGSAALNSSTSTKSRSRGHQVLRSSGHKVISSSSSYLASLFPDSANINVFSLERGGYVYPDRYCFKSLANSEEKGFYSLSMSVCPPLLCPCCMCDGPS